jgi:V/A-type H+/Na+-transporting ATPase subunit E
MANEVPQASGVQELISRIRDDGVEAGQKKAEEIIAEARREAARLLAEAQAQADETHRKASAEIESFRHAALEALKMAARDTRLQLEASVLASFEGHVKRLVAPVTSDGSVVRALLMVLAGQAAEQYPRDQQLEILISDLLLGKEEENEELDKAIRTSVLGISSNMLREGVEIIPSSEVAGGARVRVVGEDVEIDLTEAAISKLLLKHLLPRYRSILEGAE